MNKLFRYSTFVLVFTFILSFTVKAQQADFCGFDQKLEEQIKADPSFQAFLEKQERDFERSKRENPHVAGERLPILTIPVVFHIMHVGEAEGSGSNISDEQIESTIDGLNIHFRNLNPNGSPFHPSGVDTEIEFCLAQQDPNGAATTGILRVDMSGNATYAADGVGTPGMNDAAMKAVSYWDNRYYYNVWVVYKINGGNQGGTQGYATFPPPGQSNTDGTVVVFNACGYDPTGAKGYNLKSYTNDGGTMTHEIGHGLQLYHTFEGDGGGGSCPPSANGCGNGQGDCCDDTAPHKRNASSCNLGAGNACFGSNMAPTIYNWMDYSSCPDRFSQDQTDRMRNALANIRSGLNGDVCIPVYQYDAMISKIIYPSGGDLCSETFTPRVVLKNRGVQTLTSVDIEYYVDAETPMVYNWTGSLTSNTSEEVVLPDYTTTFGPHAFYANTNNPNGNPDDFPGNDSKNVAINIITGTELHLNLNVSATPQFERWSITQGGTTIVSSDGSSWQANTTIDRYICLPNECFEFHFTNDYDGWYGSTSYTLKDDQGNVIASGFNPGGSGTPVTETENFCLPFDPGFIHADFSANKRLLGVGDFVNFKDESYSVGTPADSWYWDFHDGTPTVSNQNPTHPYTVAGLYDVTLGVSNSVNNVLFDQDTLTRKDYIKVYDPVTSCTVLNNKLSGAEATSITPHPSKWGYYAGHNGDNISAYADIYFSNGTSNLVALEVPVEKVHASLPNNTVSFNIYGNNGGVPGGVLASQTVKLSDLSVGTNTVNFDTPYALSGIFFVGYTLDYTYTDTLVVGSTPFRGEGEYSSTYAKQGSNWKKVKEIFGADARASLDISVKLSFLPVPEIDLGATQVCVGSPLVFDGRPSLNETAYEWTMDDATFESGSSTSGFGTVSFSSSGVKNITLKVTGGCSISETKTVTVEAVDAPDITLNSINESCGGKNGAITADVINGSGTFTYLWDDPQGQVTKSAIQLQAGTYTVRVNDGICPVVMETTEIINQASLPTFDITPYHTSCGIDNGSAVAHPVGGTGSYTFLWNDPQGQTTKSAVNLGPGTYTVFVNDGQCPEASQTVTIEGSLPVMAQAYASQDSICEQEQILLTATGGTSYMWEDQFGQNIGIGDTLYVVPEYSESYTVNAFEGNCVGESTVDVYVTAKPIAFAKGNGTSQFSVAEMDNGGRCGFTSAGSFGTEYFWDFGDGETSVSKNPTHFYSAPGQYTVVLTVSIDNCIETTTIIVTVNPPSIQAIIEGGDTDICPGEELTLIANGGSVYVWNDGTSDFSTEPQVYVSPASTTTYTLTAYDNYGNSDTETTTIVVNPEPIVESTWANDTIWISEGGIAEFEVDTTTSNGTVYTWDFGNGDTETGTKVTRMYAVPRDYAVKLYSETAEGCYDEENIHVVVRISPEDLTIDNINEIHADNVLNIHPNPSNGVFYITLNNAENTKVSVFNLQGQELENMKTVLHSNVLHVDLSNQADGVYMVRVTTNNVTSLHRITLSR